MRRMRAASGAHGRIGPGERRIGPGERTLVGAFACGGSTCYNAPLLAPTAHSMWHSSEAGLATLHSSSISMRSAVSAEPRGGGVVGAPPALPAQRANQREPPVAQPAARAAAMKSAAASPPPRAKGSAGEQEADGAHGVLQWRPCQVPGCSSEPLNARTYLGRCRLCLPHMRADTVELNGQLVRFCQKCACPCVSPCVSVCHMG